MPPAEVLLSAILQSPSVNSNGAPAGTDDVSPPIANIMPSQVTQAIEGSNTPAAVTIVAQPPAQAQVGELFRIEVQLTISNGAPVPFRAVTAYLGDDTKMFETTANFIASQSGEPPTSFFEK